MKLLIFSDSHGEARRMVGIAKKFKDEVACVLFLGDNAGDCLAIPAVYAGPVYAIAGNCDLWTDCPHEMSIKLGGKTIWMTHGHKYGVKHGYDKIVAAATEREADICLFGHTHNPTIFQKNGTLFLNPGSISEPRGNRGKSYAVIEIIGNDALAKIMDA